MPTIVECIARCGMETNPAHKPVKTFDVMVDGSGGNSLASG
jgi:hypothetical protein